MGDNLRDIKPLTSPNLLSQAYHCEELRCHHERVDFSSLQNIWQFIRRKVSLAHGFSTHFLGPPHMSRTSCWQEHRTENSLPHLTALKLRKTGRGQGPGILKDASLIGSNFLIFSVSLQNNHTDTQYQGLNAWQFFEGHHIQNCNWQNCHLFDTCKYIKL